MTTLSEEVAQKLGLPADSDDETILQAVKKLKADSAERQVANAVISGKIVAGHRAVWLNSFAADHKGTEAVLASMPPMAVAVRTYVAPPAGPVEATSPLSDEEASAFLWRLGVRAGLNPPVAVVGPTLVGEDGSAFTSKKTGA